MKKGTEELSGMWKKLEKSDVHVYGVSQGEYEPMPHGLHWWVSSVMKPEGHCNEYIYIYIGKKGKSQQHDYTTQSLGRKPYRISIRRASGRVSTIESEGPSSDQHMPPRITLAISGQHGPFHKCSPALSSSLLAQDQSCISWLHKQAPRPVIYVSFGSIAAITEAEFLEIAWGLANSKQPFLWVLLPGLVRGKEWLERLPNGLLEHLKREDTW
ncbi:hypothetical protein GH714_012279 [Hevea brasiliensis]|uniref:Uncharacterized protein n=1 Tax=Hevea brasiliensis TaxID=3981 RepID=A0A6A6N3F8_HEVBR|nr:hypothetical protein GH714_012279 [Hevea brasiliensis]